MKRQGKICISVCFLLTLYCGMLSVHLTGCQSAAPSVPSSITGRILDITAPTITIEADRRITYLLDLSQMDMPPLKIGETVTIFYEGSLNEERFYQEVTVISIQSLQTHGENNSR